jgi:hypothetical protein
MKALKKLKLLIMALALAGTLTGILSGGHASALTGSDFNAGRIMDDAIFFNPNAMNPGDIQTFLNSKVPVCDTNGTQPRGGTTRAAYGTSQGYPPPYTCLKDFSQAIPSKAPDAYCTGGIAGGTKSAATIIYEVGQACGVSPKVLLVTLQKEQGLVTDDWPWSIQYRSAMGYGCPDTAPCDAEYYGFFNQVYNAARQFQRYAKQSTFFNYRGGQTSFVQYNPAASCGGTNVAIQNQATAGLYNYTPYQPNAAALNNLYGTGDDCSAYGNRNFWRMYMDWFGPTYTTVPFAWSYEGHWIYSDGARTQQFSATPTAVPGGTIYVRVKARNMGNQAWDRSFLHLGGSRPNDRVSPFYDSSSWLANTRPAQMSEASIAPGSIGTFDFTMKAPASPGTYREYFNLVADGHTWLNDLGMYFDINVNNPIGVSNSTNTTLNSGQTLHQDDYILSPDSQSVLTLQKDGNVLLYSNMRSAWHTITAGSGADRLIMQDDGNLVLYSPSRAVWASGTNGNPGARLIIQTDGNMVIYSASNVPLWATYTISNPDHLSYVNTTLGIGRMYPGQSLDTADRRYHLILQRDGNLVLYSPNRAIWASGTDGRNAAYLTLQSDGNLVLYDRNARPLWFTGTDGRGNNLRLTVQQDGNLVLYDIFNNPYWHTHTNGVQ